jgi:hypothetical protein
VPELREDSLEEARRQVHDLGLSGARRHSGATTGVSRQSRVGHHDSTQPRR